MSNELENIILTIDTREQNQKRIKAVEDWALSHGAIVEHSALSLCDYSLMGEFRGVSMNIGIEAKSLSDFATSYSELSDKLARSYQLYDDVALFVEAGNYTFTPDADNFHAIIDNPAVRNGTADVLPLAVYENMLASFQREGVHIRQLRSEVHFPYAIASLLISITKPIHTGLKELIRNGCSSARYGELTKKEYIAAYSNILGKFPQLGFKRIDKIMKHYPNMFWLCSASEESLIQVMGKQVGMTLYALLRNPMLVTEEWRNNYHRDGIEKDEPICNYANSKKHAECMTPDHFKHSSHQDKDITSIITHHPSLSCDTSSHPGTFLKSVTHHQPDDPPRPPIAKISEVKQEDIPFPPAETNMDIGLDDKRTEYQEVKPNVIDPKTHKMNLDMTLKEFMADDKSHLMQEIVDHCEGWGAPYIFDRVMANVTSGNIKKMTLNDKVTYQRA